MKWPWKSKKEETPIVKQLITPNLPLIESLGKLSPTFRNFQNRAEYSKVFSEVSELYSVIMYSARAFSNMRLQLFKTDNTGDIVEEIQSHEVLERLAQPNPLTSWTDFLINYYANKKVQGNSYVLKSNLPGFDKIKDVALWILPAQYVYVIPQQRNVKNIAKYWSNGDKADFIKGYAFYYTQVDLSGGTHWQPNEILHTKEPNLRINQTQFFYDLINGMSPIETLNRNISNIDKGYEAQNVILKKRGALGILSPQPQKDQVGNTIYTAKDKEDLQKQFEN
jgi:phage portal protein BeeE